MKKRKLDEEEKKREGEEFEKDYLEGYETFVMPSTPTISQLGTAYSSHYEYSFLPSFDDNNRYFA